MRCTWPSPPRRAAHWIGSPDGEYTGSNGSDWCRTCAIFVIRHLRRHDRKHREDYRLDGGWRTEHDHQPFCAHCCERLDGSLTTYGAEAEVECWQTYGVRPGNPYEAHSLWETLNVLGYASKPEDVEMAVQACDFAEAFLWCAT